MAYNELTFSQREGKIKLPDVMRLEHVPKLFRQLVWSAIDSDILRTYSFDSWIATSEFHEITKDYIFYVQEYYHDEIKHDYNDFNELLRNLVKTGNYHEVLTLIEFILSHELCSDPAILIMAIGN